MKIKVTNYETLIRIYENHKKRIEKTAFQDAKKRLISENEAEKEKAIRILDRQNYVLFEKYNQHYTIIDDRINNEWDAIASYMNDEIRESLHNELTQWTEKDFLKSYLELEKNYKGENLKSILKNEFEITEKDLNEFLNS